MTDRVPNRLPKRAELRVDQSKVVDYLLNPKHPDGASKARFFQHFGFDQGGWQVLVEALQRHGREREIVAVETTPYGTKYRLECALSTPQSRCPCIATIWVADEDGALRLITAFPIHR